MLFAAVISALTALSAAEPAIRAVGVIGNTGEQGPALLQQTTDLSYRGHGTALGCGLSLDVQGTLWTRLDDGFITRLTLDGRQLGRFSAPKSVSGYDALVAVGDRVLLLANGDLLALPLDSAPGAAFKPIGVKLRTLAHTPYQGRLAAISADGRPVWIKPADGSSETIAGGLRDAWLIECTTAGELVVGTRADTRQPGAMHKLAGGAEVVAKGWPKEWDLVIPGIAMCPDALVWDGDGFFQCGSGHVSHLDPELNPAPGTVLGMQGKFVIGIGADWRPELGVARGIVRIRDGLYAVGGSWGQPFFATWPDRTRSMHLVSWFTARPDCRAMAINADGEVFVDRLRYEWNATPDAFPVLGEGAAGTAGQIVRVGDRLLLRLDRWAHGGSGSWALPVYSGERMQECDFLGNDKLDQEAWWKRADQSGGQRIFPAVAYPRQDGLVLLELADAAGARSLLLHRNGRYRATGGAVAFKTTTPGQVLTSLAMRDDQTLLAAIDGYVVELKPAGDDWQEQRSWNSWGTAAGEHFGGSIMIASHDGRLLVTDCDRHRVLWFAADGGKPKAQFGTTDSVGSDLGSLNSPGLVVIWGLRAVVHDRGNQRLVKVALQP